MIRAVLFDLDGVIRHFDHDPGLEARYGLDDGAIARTAFTAALLDEVTTGRITRTEWIARIGDAIGAPAAAAEWGRSPFHVDPDLLRLADDLRARGIRTAILTNGTDTIAEELRGTGVDEHFDPIVNSADIGCAKPDPSAFRHVLDALALPADEVFFTDDSPSKLRGADEVGMITHHFTGVGTLRRTLESLAR